MIVIYLGEELLGGLLELESDELEALLLETLDDLANQTTLDAIWLDHDVGALAGHLVLSTWSE